MSPANSAGFCHSKEGGDHYGRQDHQSDDLLEHRENEPRHHNGANAKAD